MWWEFTAEISIQKEQDYELGTYIPNSFQRKERILIFKLYNIIKSDITIPIGKIKLVLKT